MARLKASASFVVATKHLFRHLHEPRVLRQNPLVRHLFEDKGRVGRGSGYERKVLDRIHQLVRQGADHCLDADVVAGQKERGLRQHAIITMQCLEDRPIREVAGSLGISYRHCYRERAKICRRVARYVCDRRDTPQIDYLLDLDEFQLLADCAMRAISVGRNHAFRLWDNLILLASSPEQRIEALHASALVSIHFGDVERADVAYATAQGLSAEHFGVEESPSRNVAEARVDLIGAALACHRGDYAELFRLAERAVSLLRLVQENAAAQVRELYVESLNNLGSILFSSGDLYEAHQVLTTAEFNLRYIRTTSTQLRTLVMGNVWGQRNYLLMNSTAWHPSWQRLKALAATFEEAFSSGWICQAVEALGALTDYHAFACNDAEALSSARLATLLAQQQPSEGFQASTALRVAVPLLSTRHWEYALSLVPDICQVRSSDAYSSSRTSYFAAERALRQSSFEDALALSNGEGAYVKTINLKIRWKLVAAAAALGLERRQAACDSIEEAIAIAEKCLCAPLLRNAYDLAERVTADRGFRRKANEIARLLTA